DISKPARPQQLQNDAAGRNEHDRRRKAKTPGLAEQKSSGSNPDRKEIKIKPFERPGFDHQILHAGCRRLAENRAVAFKPSEKRHDLVKLGKPEPRQPAEGKEKNRGSDPLLEQPESHKADGEDHSPRKRDKRHGGHAAVQLDLAAFARLI